MDKPSGRHIGRQRHNARITQTHLLKLNGGVPGMSLGLSFCRGLLVHSCQAYKKDMGVRLHRFLYRGKCLDNDVGDGPCHLTDILYDAFYITVLHNGTEHTIIVAQAETASRGKWQHGAKTSGFNSALASTKRSALDLPSHMLSLNNK